MVIKKLDIKEMERKNWTIGTEEIKERYREQGKGWLCKNFHGNLIFPLKFGQEGKLRNEKVAQRGWVGY